MDFFLFFFIFLVHADMELKGIYQGKKKGKKKRIDRDKNALVWHLPTTFTYVPSFRCYKSHYPASLWSNQYMDREASKHHAIDHFWEEILLIILQPFCFLKSQLKQIN